MERNHNFSQFWLRSSEAVLLLDSILENKCLAKVQLHSVLLNIFGSKILVDDPTNLANLYNLSQYI